LRGRESDADAAFVEQLASSLGLPFILRSADVLGDGGNLEQAGRDARLQFFRNAIAASEVDRVATGHTLSDQAETVVHRLLRGSGTAGLAGILPVTPEGLIRPLLWTTREEILDYLRQNNLTWREDSSNISLDLDRNRIRHDLLPRLVSEYNPSVAQALSQTADIARDEEAYWSVIVESLASDHIVFHAPAAILNTDRLLSLQRAVARRLVRHALKLVKGDLRSINAQHVEYLLNMSAAKDGHARVQLPGLDVFRSFEWLRIAPPRGDSRADRDYEFPLQVPARIALSASETEISVDLLDIASTCKVGWSQKGYNEERNWVDAGRLLEPLVLRNWRPGDSYALPGHSIQKIKLYFQKERIPIWERQGWPVITSAGQVVWARKFGTAAGFEPSADAARILCVRETGKNR
jgi:tRNA(Ile)-lysidine synthase